MILGKHDPVDDGRRDERDLPMFLVDEEGTASSLRDAAWRA